MNATGPAVERHRRALRAAWGLLGVSLALAPGAALAGPVVVWLQDEVPAEDARARADHQTGGTEHLALPVLRYASQPASESDEAALAALREAVADAREDWDEFEVELTIAARLDEAVRQITLLTDPRDVEDVAEALLFQGAAALRAFEPASFGTDERASRWRTTADGVAVPTAWVEAWGLRERLGLGAPDRSDFVDGQAWADWERLGAAILRVQKGGLVIPEDAGEVVVDARPAEAGTLVLPAGLHWVHTVRDGQVRQRSLVRVGTGETVGLPAALSEDDVEAAVAAVRSGDAEALPGPFGPGLAALAEEHGGAVFLAVADGRRVTVLGVTDDARVTDETLITAVLFGEVGGGIARSRMFEDQETGAERSAAPVLAGAASGSAGVELGISYFAMAAGADVQITPGQTVRYANGDGTDNVHSSVLARPWGGIGVYALRPTTDRPTFLVLGEVGWSQPAHLVYGGRLVVGIPVAAGEKTWVRIAAGATYGASTLWSLPDDPVSLLQGYLRVGVGSRL